MRIDPNFEINEGTGCSLRARRNATRASSGGFSFALVCAIRGQLHRSGLAARFLRRAGAFTLVEVAMAVLVLAMVLTTSLTVMQRAFLELDTARNLEIAGNILQCEIEAERLLPWASVNNAAYQPAIDASFTRNPAIAGRFTLSRVLTTLALRSGQMVQITLTVRWRSYDGRTVSRSYTTYYTQGGLYEYFYNNP
jgi:type II secretory pathway pseudopilin PulG